MCPPVGWRRAHNPCWACSPAPAAIRVAIGMAKPREVVIVAGKGHVDYQEYWDGADMDNPDTVKVGAGQAHGACSKRALPVRLAGSLPGRSEG